MFAQIVKAVIGDRLIGKADSLKDDSKEYKMRFGLVATSIRTFLFVGSAFIRTSEDALGIPNTRVITPFVSSLISTSETVVCDFFTRTNHAYKQLKLSNHFRSLFKISNFLTK